MENTILQKNTIEGVVAFYETFAAVSRTIGDINPFAMSVNSIIERNWDSQDESPERMLSVRRDITLVCKNFLDPLYSPVDKVHFLDMMMVANTIPRSATSATTIIDKILLLAMDDFYGAFTDLEVRGYKAMATRLKDIFELIYAPV